MRTIQAVIFIALAMTFVLFFAVGALTVNIAGGTYYLPVFGVIAGIAFVGIFVTVSSICLWWRDTTIGAGAGIIIILLSLLAPPQWGRGALVPFFIGSILWVVFANKGVQRFTP